jgi:hypothetical protein
MDGTGLHRRAISPEYGDDGAQYPIPAAVPEPRATRHVSRRDYAKPGGSAPFASQPAVEERFQASVGVGVVST